MWPPFAETDTTNTEIVMLRDIWTSATFRTPLPHSNKRHTDAGPTNLHRHLRKPSNSRSEKQVVSRF